MVRTVAGLDRSSFHSNVAYFVPRRDLVPDLESVGVTPVFLDHRGAGHSVSTLRTLLDLIDSDRPDIIHTNLSLDRIFGSLAGRMRGLPVITSLHTTARGFATEGESYRSLARSYAEAYLSRGLSVRFVAVGEEVAGSHVRTMGFDPDRMVVITPGVPPEWLTPIDPGETTAARQQLGVTGTPLIVNVGRLHPDKGQLVLVEAMPRILESYPLAQLVIAGDGELRHVLQVRVEQLGLTRRVLMPGAFRNVRGLLAIADVYVTASEREGRGIALLEAMAVGVPIVATRIPAHDEVLSHGETALLVPVGDPICIANSILDLVNCPRRDLGQRAKEEVALRYTLNGWIEQLADLYMNVVTS